MRDENKDKMATLVGSQVIAKNAKHFSSSFLSERFVFLFCRVNLPVKDPLHTCHGPGPVLLDLLHLFGREGRVPRSPVFVGHVVRTGQITLC